MRRYQGMFKENHLNRKENMDRTQNSLPLTRIWNLEFVIQQGRGRTIRGEKGKQANTNEGPKWSLDINISSFPSSIAIWTASIGEKENLSSSWTRHGGMTPSVYLTAYIRSRGFGAVRPNSDTFQKS